MLKTGLGLIASASLSDLFFNHNHDDAVEYENGKFVGFNEEKMMGEAKSFATSIADIGGPEVAPEELLKDFYSRL